MHHPFTTFIDNGEGRIGWRSSGTTITVVPKRLPTTTTNPTLTEQEVGRGNLLYRTDKSGKEVILFSDTQIFKGPQASKGLVRVSCAVTGRITSQIFIHSVTVDLIGLVFQPSNRRQLTSSCRRLLGRFSLPFFPFLS